MVGLPSVLSGLTEIPDLRRPHQPAQDRGQQIGQPEQVLEFFGQGDSSPWHPAEIEHHTRRHVAFGQPLEDLVDRRQRLQLDVGLDLAVGFTHQDPGFVDLVMNKKAEVVRAYFPPDANCLLSVMDHCADRVIARIRVQSGSILLFAHREILRILTARWIGLAPIEGRRLLLATGSVSVLGYDHDLTEPVIHVWNGRVNGP